MKPKTRLTSRPVAEIVAEGEAEIGMQQIVAILPVKGAELVGPLPGELGTMTRFTGGIGAESQAVSAVKALIEFLTGPDAAPSFKAKGFEPG
jgi:molybdate transport system substrate-binding protein